MRSPRLISISNAASLRGAGNRPEMTPARAHSRHNLKLRWMLLDLLVYTRDSPSLVPLSASSCRDLRPGTPTRPLFLTLSLVNDGVLLFSGRMGYVPGSTFRINDLRDRMARFIGQDLSCFRGERLVFAGLSFDLAPADSLILRGPNGSGKTTLIRLLMGFQKASCGKASIDNLDCHHDRVRVHQRVSYLPGDARLFRAMKAKKILKFFADLRSDGDFERSLELADFLELDINRRVAFMSTGMRQKLATAICLSVHAPLVILDEPTANLDPTVRMKIMELVRQAGIRGQTVLLSSHVLPEIEAVCNRVVLLRSGKKVFEGVIDEIRETHLLTAAKRTISIPVELAGNIEQIESADFLKLSIESLNADTMSWIGEQKFEDLQIQPLGLQAIYDRYHCPV